MFKYYFDNDEDNGLTVSSKGMTMQTLLQKSIIVLIHGMEI